VTRRWRKRKRWIGEGMRGMKRQAISESVGV